MSFPQACFAQFADRGPFAEADLSVFSIATDVTFLARTNARHTCFQPDMNHDVLSAVEDDNVANLWLIVSHTFLSLFHQET